MTFEIYKLEWILSRHTFGNTTKVYGEEHCDYYWFKTCKGSKEYI